MTKSQTSAARSKAAEPLAAEPAATLDRDAAEEIASIFHLLGEPNRLRIVAACLDGPRTVNELALAAGVSPSLASHHLRLLKAARLLRAERRGKYVLYGADDDHVRAIVGAMIEHVAEPHHGAEEEA